MRYKQNNIHRNDTLINKISLKGLSALFLGDKVRRCFHTSSFSHRDFVLPLQRGANFQLAHVQTGWVSLATVTYCL